MRVVRSTRRCRRVAASLHVEEAYRASRPDRERPPVPRAAVQHDGLAGSKHERATSSRSVRESNVLEAGATASTDAASSGVSTCVWVACRYITAHRSRPGGVDLVGAVLDGVEVGVVPLEVQRVLAVGGVGVGTRHPSEGRPGRVATGAATIVRVGSSAMEGSLRGCRPLRWSDGRALDRRGRAGRRAQRDRTRLVAGVARVRCRRSPPVVTSSW